MKNLIFVAVLFIASTTVALGQKEITGKVYDALTKEPLSGASIKNKTTRTGSTSTTAGVFTVSYAEGDTVLISFVGYSPQSIPAANLYNGMFIALEPSAAELQPITITASREAGDRLENPASIHKISPKTVDETKFTGVYELINKTPGVVMGNLNNEQHSMSIRQPLTTASYFLYMEDGVPIRPTGVFNHNALLEINQFAISSVEVVKGPVSSVYGPEAVGGAINFLSHRPTAVLTAKAGVQVDHWGYRRVQFGTGATFGKFGYYIAGMGSMQRDSWLARSDYDKHVIHARFEYAFTPATRLIGTVMYGKYDSQTSGSVDSIAFFSRTYPSNNDFTYRKVEAMRSRLTVEHDWNKNSRTFITFFQRMNKHGQNPSYRISWNPNSNPTKGRGEINSNDFESYGVIAQHSQRFEFLKSKWLTGLVYDFSPVDYWAHRIDLNAQLRPDGQSVELFTIDRERPDLPISNYNATIKNVGAYTQYDFNPIKNLRMSLGSRYDQMGFDYTNMLDSTSGTREYSQFTPKIGLTYDLKKDRGVYANYSRGFSPPALTSVFRPKPNSNPVEFYYNLNPAQFDNKEIGFWAAFLNKKLHLDIALYQMNGRNELLSIRQPDNSFDFQSAGKTLHQGVEIGLTFKPSEQLLLRSGGTVSLHKFEDFKISDRQTDEIKKLDGFEMPSAPRTTANTELSYYPKYVKNLRASLEWQYVSGWHQNQINTVKAEGYNLLNFRMGYKWKSLEVFSNIMNLTDALYATNASRGNGANDRANYTPAAPRTFVLGLQVNFTDKKTQKQ